MACYIDPNHCLSWDALLPYVHPYVRGAPDEIMLHNIRLATIELCRRSGCLHDENVLDLQKNVTRYELETECDYDIVRIFEVIVQNTWKYQPSLTKNRRPCFFSPYQFYVQQPNTIILNSPPSQDIEGGLQVEFIVLPKQDSCVLDQMLYELWAEGIAAGAIYRLLMMPNTAWFSPPMAKEFEIKYRNCVARARTGVDLNFTSGPMMMKTERWV